MGTSFYLVVVLCAVFQLSVAPPVTNNKQQEEDENSVGGLEDYMEYHRYLKEVVNALESDPDFRSKLEKAQEHDIKSGKIADELEFVSHHVRSRLDEIKRVELERLKELVTKKRKMENESKEDSHGHLDHSNPHTFEIDDLKKLIAKTTEDLAEADKKRRVEFKEYEMQKELEKQKKLNETADEEARKKLEHDFQEREEKHKQHAQLHEPGHKAQLEEVWEGQDQMQQQFDPKTFFMLHDLDSNGLWDQDEVKALFIKELDKMYAQGTPEDDMRERIEEMERMRESVFKEMDYNRDGFIDFNEFMIQTKRAEFQQDNGWQSLDQQRQFTQEELEAYIRAHQANQIPRGYHQNPQYQHGVPPAGYHSPNQMHPPQGQYQQYQQPPPPGYHQPPVQYQQPPPAGYQQAQQHPPAGYQQPNQPPAGGYQQPNQPPPGAYQQQQKQPPQGGYQQQQKQPPQGGYQQQQHNQHPQGGYQQQQQNQPPQGGYQPQQNQPPQAGYQQQNQPPPPASYQQQPPQAGKQQQPPAANEKLNEGEQKQINQPPPQVQPVVQANQQSQEQPKVQAHDDPQINLV